MMCSIAASGCCSCQLLLAISLRGSRGHGFPHAQLVARACILAVHLPVVPQRHARTARTRACAGAPWQSSPQRRRPKLLRRRRRLAMRRHAATSVATG